MAFLPPDAPAWDDASNNKWLVSGRGSLIINPPSAWAVAKRDAPQVAEQCWTHGFPVGPKGRFAPFLPYYWSIWKFAKNKEAAKSLLVHLSQPEPSRRWSGPVAATICRRSRSSPPSRSGPRKARRRARSITTRTRYKHQTLSISASPAPPKVAQQIYTQATLTKMCVRFYQGEPMEKTLAWAEGELEGFMRSWGCTARHARMQAAAVSPSFHAHEIG